MTNAVKATCHCQDHKLHVYGAIASNCSYLCAGEIEASYQIFDHGISDYKD